MTPHWTPFNVNEQVRVKLTDAGKAALTRLHEEEVSALRAQGITGDLGNAFELDAEGYWPVQLWKLMVKLGPVSGLGFPDLFDANILLTSAA